MRSTQKLAAIYNVWDADYLLPHSILQIRDQVDIVIIVYQNVSNYGEHYQPEIPSDLCDHIIHFTPRSNGALREYLSCKSSYGVCFGVSDQLSPGKTHNDPLSYLLLTYK